MFILIDVFIQHYLPSAFSHVLSYFNFNTPLPTLHWFVLIILLNAVCNPMNWGVVEWRRIFIGRTVYLLTARTTKKHLGDDQGVPELCNLMIALRVVVWKLSIDAQWDKFCACWRGSNSWYQLKRSLGFNTLTTGSGLVLRRIHWMHLKRRAPSKMQPSNSSSHIHEFASYYRWKMTRFRQHILS